MNKIVKKITRALLLSIYSDDYFGDRIENHFNNQQNDLQVDYMYQFILNFQNKNYNFVNFLELYINKIFFTETRKESISKKNKFTINNLFSQHNLRELFDYIITNMCFGALSYVMASLMISYLYFIDNNNYLIFYGYHFIEYSKNKKFNELINDSKKTIEKLTSIKSQYDLNYVIQKIKHLNLNFVDQEFEILIYGSLAKGCNDNTSDIDIAIVWNEYTNLIPLYEITIAKLLESLFSNTYIDISSIVKPQKRNSFENRILSYAIKIR